MQKPDTTQNCQQICPIPRLTLKLLGWFLTFLNDEKYHHFSTITKW